jgi:spore coat protein Y
MEKKHNHRCICQEMKQLLDEQERLSFKGFRFVCEKVGFDTIPFILTNGRCPFEAFGIMPNGQLFTTKVFRLEKVDSDDCCATLSLLVPLDFDGFQVEAYDEVYTYLRTDECINVDLSCFCTIQPLSPRMVNRPLPIVEPKC